MLRTLMITVVAGILVANLALAEPRVDVAYFSGVPKVTLSGDWSRTHYTIYRAVEPQGPFRAITSLDVLCLGSCFVDDYDAMPGQTYWYRFDIVPEVGNPVSFGPYAVTISSTLALHLNAAVVPNPSYGPARLELFLAGRPNQPSLEVHATLLDLQGRHVRTLFRGPLGRGKTTLAWDGRDDSGRELRAGAYFLRFVTPLGSTITRVVRAN
jgi:hypothetical protein